jgi:hypothetical protein
MLCYGPHAEKHPTFTLFDRWIPSSRKLDRDDALRTLAERFFTSHGPATVRDFIWWTGLTVADAKLALHLASPALQNESDFYFSAENISASGAAPRAHLLPGFDEILLGYRDRSATLAARYADRVVPGGNGVFQATLVLDGQVRGIWRRTTRKKDVLIEAMPFARLTSADKKAFHAPIERYAKFAGVAVTLEWPSRTK